ncbi:MAG TPA: alpha/beta hydrolase [Anaerolineae bacterium]|jgi:pimeloyl-ACP methyl ester carboxylesterase|nr:alpha/beta hydrolase [Anaerolineae bacterium]
MPTTQAKSGFVNIDKAQIYYEIAGQGTPLVMIHAGVADSRQWNNEFAFFARSHRVVRYDMRGFGKSAPVEGEFSHMSDLVALLDALGLHEPLILMGCSMGGGLAMDFALTQPSRAKALIMVDSGPSGLELDVPVSAKFAEVEKAFNAGDLDLVSELETQIWFDGVGRTPEQVNQPMRKLLFEMNRQALAYEVMQLGKRLPNTQVPASGRLADLRIPVLVIVGVHDTAYTLAAADYMAEKIESARKVTIEDAAHLPNMDHPEKFRQILEIFLQGLASP